MPKDPPFFWEAHLTQEHWADLPAELATWYEYNYSLEDRLKRQQVIGEIVPVIREIIVGHLTARQRQVVTLYFVEQHTQVQIAERLHISQPTVSQHLNGKKRNGTKVGGAMRRIRKSIRKEAARSRGGNEGIKILLILDALLDGEVSHRQATKLLGHVV